MGIQPVVRGPLVVRDGIAGGPWPSIQKNVKKKKMKRKEKLGGLVKLTGMGVYDVKCELNIITVILNHIQVILERLHRALQRECVCGCVKLLLV